MGPYLETGSLQRSSRWNGVTRGALNPYDWRHYETGRCGQGTLCGDTRGECHGPTECWTDASTCQAMPEATGSRRRRRGAVHSPVASRDSMPCWHHHFTLPASRPMRQHTSVVLIHLGFGTSLWPPWAITISTKSIILVLKRSKYKKGLCQTCQDFGRKRWKQPGTSDSEGIWAGRYSWCCFPQVKMGDGTSDLVKTWNRSVKAGIHRSCLKEQRGCVFALCTRCVQRILRSLSTA